MELSDISDACHGEREHHFMDSLAGSDPSSRAEVYDLARGMATAEMLDEIHTMLRELLRRTAATLSQET